MRPLLLVCTCVIAVLLTGRESIAGVETHQSAIVSTVNGGVAVATVSAFNRPGATLREVKISIDMIGTQRFEAANEDPNPVEVTGIFDVPFQVTAPIPSLNFNAGFGGGRTVTVPGKPPSAEFPPARIEFDVVGAFADSRTATTDLDGFKGTGNVELRAIFQDGNSRFFGPADGGPISPVNIDYRATVTYTFDDPTAVVPVPPSFVLAGMGILGLCGYGWRRRRSNSPMAA